MRRFFVMLATSAVLTASALLPGCAAKEEPKLVNMDEYVFEMAFKTCYERIHDLMSDYDPAIQSASFDQCMGGKGYPPSTYKDRWINF